MDSILEGAFEAALAIENRSLSFYSALSSRVKDPHVKKIFDLMGKEEAEHLELVCSLYTGSTMELVDILLKTNMYLDPYYRSLLECIDCSENEKTALEISLKEEQACIELYSVYVETIRDPKIRNIFLQLLSETRKHCDMLKDEYMRHMNMVDSTDQDIYVQE